MQTQPQEAVGGATNDDPVVAAEPTLDDRFAAIIDDDQADDTPQGDDPPIVGDDDIELEADEVNDLPPIHAPVSWPDDDKAAFAELPRDLQERVSAREADREKFVQAKSREAATARQVAAEQARTEVEKAREAHVQQLVALLPELPEEPSAHLMVQNPQAYAEQLDYRNYVVGLYQQAQSTIAGIDAQRKADDEQASQQSARATVELLQSEFPEFLDEGQRPELQKKLSSTALALGYSQDHLTGLTGTDLLALRNASEWKAKADRLDTLMAKRMERVREAKKLPAVSRPGVAQPKGAVASQRYQADRQAMRNGDRDAANRVFSKFL